MICPWLQPPDGRATHFFHLHISGAGSSFVFEHERYMAAFTSASAIHRLFGASSIFPPSVESHILLIVNSGHFEKLAVLNSNPSNLRKLHSARTIFDLIGCKLSHVVFRSVS